MVVMLVVGGPISPTTTTMINKTCLCQSVERSGTVAAGEAAGRPVHWQRWRQRWWLTFSPLLLCTAAAVCASAPPPAPAEAN